MLPPPDTLAMSQVFELPYDALRAILRDARDWGTGPRADRQDQALGPRVALVGSLALHLVEFAVRPVVVVPDRSPARRPSDRVPQA